MRLLATLAVYSLLHAQPDAATSRSLGLKAASSGDLESAASHFRKACEMAPKDEDTCYYLARTLYTLARYAEAKPPFEIAIKAAARKKRERVERAEALNFVALDQPEEADGCVARPTMATRAPRPKSVSSSFPAAACPRTTCRPTCGSISPPPRETPPRHVAATRWRRP